MNDIKCMNCGKKIGEEDIQGGEVRIKCPKCGQTTVIISKLHAFPVKEESYTEKVDKKIEKK